jgi:hypothetical protein
MVLIIVLIGLVVATIIFAINEIIELESKPIKKKEKPWWDRPDPRIDSYTRYEGILRKYKNDFSSYYIEVDRNKFPDMKVDKIPCVQSYNDALEWDKKGIDGTKVRFYLDWEYNGCTSWQYPVIEIFYQK